LAIVGLLAVPGLAFAYPAPPVTPNSPTWSGTTTETTNTVLASTGAGFSVTTAVLVAVLVLVAGVGLLFLGNRVRKSGARND